MQHYEVINNHKYFKKYKKVLKETPKRDTDCFSQYFGTTTWRKTVRLPFQKQTKAKKKKKNSRGGDGGDSLKKKTNPLQYIYIDVFPLMWRERENKKTKANKKKEIEETFLEIK